MADCSPFPIAARFTPRSILPTNLVGCLVSVGVILLWPGSQIAVWVGTLGLGLSMAAIFPTTLSLAERYLRITGQVTGRFFAGASAGGMSLPWLIGQLFEPSGPRATMVVIMADLAIAAGVLSTLLFFSSRSTVNEGCGTT